MPLHMHDNEMEEGRAEGEGAGEEQETDAEWHGAMLSLLQARPQHMATSPATMSSDGGDRQASMAMPAASEGQLASVVVHTKDTARRLDLARIASRAEAAGRQFVVRYYPRMVKRDREITLSTGIVFVSGRGLDLNLAPPKGYRRTAEGRALRRCRGSAVQV